MACAATMPGAMASAYAGSGTPLTRQPIHAPTAPSAMAPQMPRPPSQIRSASSGFLPSPKYRCQSVATWYRRPPTRPNGTANTAMSMTVPAVPPRAIHRRSPHQIARMMPAMMHKAYARIGMGPISHTPRSGLGMLARKTLDATVTRVTVTGDVCGGRIRSGNRAVATLATVVTREDVVAWVARSYGPRHAEQRVSEQPAAFVIDTS